ncbi:hypothetical protein B0T25DRAFT_630790 [Lasiosphaeria hispida]|uniref:Rhodopsin domain-containing protein n=1 Tax=Lasiosphaeria hispida TaxID=260671 RepID=A0AAJ0HN71_9PEZI|nr:hypothetical protein B0T25DRAFT_630790 [Lasiosphaeria hispida]
MSGMGGQAPMAMAVLWTMAVVTLVFVVLRVYTRAVLVRSFGSDDYVYVLSGFMLLFYAVFLQVSSHYGFGQPIAALDLDSAVRAVEWEMIGQTFAVVGMATAKVSLGLFLLRIVVKPWHRVVLWIASVLILAVSLVVGVLFWTQCLPPRSLYDPRVKGTCGFGIAPFSLLLGVACIVADFFFAAFPWVFIWNLNMKHKEKVTIAASMSVGVVAGVAGIIRTVSLGGIASRNYTEDTVPLIIWSAVELAVTMVCAGVPVLRPLYRRIKGGITTDDSAGNSNGYYKHGTGNDNSTNQDSIRLKNMSSIETDVENNRGFPGAHPKLGIRGPTTVTYIKGDNHSDEEILGPEYRQSQAGAQPGQIHIHEHVDVHVERAGGGRTPVPRPESGDERDEESLREVA